MGSGLLLSGCAANSLETRSSKRSATTITFVGVNVVDVRAGRLLPARNVVIAGDRIVAIQSSDDPFPPGMRIVPSKGKYLMPGLWDMHVHVAAQSYLRLFVANGVVGVRDMGGGLDRSGDGCESLHPSILRHWRTEVREGRRMGPELVISGPAVSGTGWPSSLAARTPDEARSSVAALKRHDVDFLKVYEAIPLRAYRALVAEANQTGLQFAGHVPEEVGPMTAIWSGQRSIEHIRDPLLVCFSAEASDLEEFFDADGWGADDRAWGRAAHAACPAIIAAFRDRPVWFTPTLTVEKAKVSVEDARHVGDERRNALPPSVRAGYSEYVQEQLGQPAAERASRRLWWSTQQKVVRRFSDGGVRLLAGTDAACEGGLPGHSLHGELRELVAAGLSPAEALRAATLEPARYLGRNDEGEVLPGYRANLLLLDANPLENIEDTQSISAVVLQGKLVIQEGSDAR